jgi:predicted dinucleotide-binding enzyme
MKFGVLGTGMVGRTIGTKLVSLGHEVRMGARTATNEKARDWAREHAPKATFGSFGDAAAFGETIFNCTNGANSIEALRSAGDRLANKIVIDVANPLDFSKGMPPTLTIVNDDSLGERIQKTFPRAKVVKALNTINCAVMVDPQKVAGGEHDVFVAGNDGAAKEQVTELLRTFGWKNVVDAGDIGASRGLEAYLLLWVRLMGALKTPSFNVHVVR